MSLRSLTTTLATAALIGVTALSGGGSDARSGLSHSHPTVGSQHRGNGHRTSSAACTRVSDCHVVAHVDVDGDGRPDQIGWRQISDRSVQIRVHTSTGKLLTARVDVRLWWGGGAWAGATRIDNRPGVELLIGSRQGAHTPMYTMLTFRNGGLAVERSPSALSALWQVDAADGDYMGWWRHALPDGQIAMTQKIAVRSGRGSQFRGHNVTYKWSGGRWHRSAADTVTYASGRAASVIAGFHVRGLKSFPGLG
jgi:hypothetical protein